MHTSSSLEPLEARIAPATLVNPTTLTYHDTDGDVVTVKLTKALPAGAPGLAEANTIFHFDAGVVVAAGQPDLTQQQLQLIDFSNQPLLAGTGVAVTAKLTGNGDGFANVGRINSPGVPLGAISIHGDLGSFVVGDAGANALSIKSLTVQSIGRYGTSTQAAGGDLNSSVTHGLGALTVKSDIVDATLTIGGAGSASLGNVTIGGSLIGGAAAHSGKIEADNIGNVKIGGDIRGGDGGDSGVIRADLELGNVTLGGSLLGGTGAGAGQFTGEIAGYQFGAITIAGDMNAGPHDESGKIIAQLKIASLTVKGSIIGGAGSENTGNAQDQGQVNAEEGIGNITIGGDLRGGSGPSGAEIFTNTNTFGVIKIGGSIVGGGGTNTGLIKNTAGPTGAITIGGDIVGGSGPQSGGINTGFSVASVTVKGSVTGGAGSGSGRIQGVNMVGPVTIGGSLTGGASDHTGFVGGNVLKTVTVGGSVVGAAGNHAGAISALAGLTGVTIGGSLVGGTGPGSGLIENFSDITGQIVIGGSLVGGSAAFAGAVVSHGGLGGLTLGGSLVAGSVADTGEILVEKDIDALTIKGGILGTAAQHATIAAGGVTASASHPYVALPKVTITGDVQFADITAGSALGQTSGDAQIGSISIGGDFIASSIAAGVAPGQHGYGAGDTLLPGGTADKLATIASITIAGQALGTVGGSDQYGIVAELIKSLKVGGSVVPLTPMPHNDNRPLGTTGDLTVHEI